MKFVNNIFLIYCSLLAILITISGVLSAKNSEALFFQLLFLPVTIYFAWSIYKMIFKKNIDFSQAPKRTVLISLVIFVLLVALGSIQIITTKNNDNLQVQPQLEDKKFVMPRKKQ